VNASDGKRGGRRLVCERGTYIDISHGVDATLRCAFFHHAHADPMSCENCFKGSELPGIPSGEMVGDAYFAAGSSEAVSERKKTAVVLLTDIFGLPLKNSKIMADTLAQRLGVDVWVPDLFAGA
jgi:hypothetical protein